MKTKQNTQIKQSQLTIQSLTDIHIKVASRLL